MKFRVGLKNNLIIGFGISIVTGILVVSATMLLSFATQTTQKEVIALASIRRLILQEQTQILRYLSDEQASLRRLSMAHQRFRAEILQHPQFSNEPNLQFILDEEAQLISMLLGSEKGPGILNNLREEESAGIFSAREQIFNQILPRHSIVLGNLDAQIIKQSSQANQREFVQVVLIVNMIVLAAFLEIIIAMASIRYATNANARLERKNKQLRRLNRIMTHEVRTPLNIIRDYAERLQGVLSGEKKKEVSVVSNMARYLLNLIDDMMNIAKVEAGIISSKPEIFVVSDVIIEIVSSVSPLAREKNLKLVVDTDKNVGEIYTDKIKFKQILMNFISNAIKFTERGSVTVKSKIEDKNLIVEVIDTGIGIKKENMGELFKEFGRVGTSQKQKYAGTGLGLSISKRLSNILGGNVEARSVFGKGSTFTLKIPIGFRAEV